MQILKIMELLISQYFMKLISIVLCVGAESRLWPVSRELHPKPFIRLADEGWSSDSILRTHKKKCEWEIKIAR
jgi:mannose-1-phosphate guanylyltransferase